MKYISTQTYVIIGEPPLKPQPVIEVIRFPILALPIADLAVCSFLSPEKEIPEILTFDDKLSHFNFTTQAMLINICMEYVGAETNHCQFHPDSLINPDANDTDS